MDITDEPYQEIIFTYFDDDITFTIRFLTTVEIWVMSVAYKDIFVEGIKLSVGVPHLAQHLVPFDVIVSDTSGKETDPVLVSDFLTGRCVFYFLEPTEADELRGYPIEP